MGPVLDRVFREEAGRLTASLVRLLGDFDLAEELVSDAVVEALRRWPEQGIPDRPAAWLLTTARRRGIDNLRRQKVFREKLAQLAALRDIPADEPDDRLRLLFTCCHPALNRDAQVALTLRAVAGLTTAEIARAFLVSEQAVAKRIARAKQKIATAAIPYRVPPREEWSARLDQVLTVVYLVFNEGYMATGGPPMRRDLARDAEWMASLLVRLMPREAEPLGLLALIRLALARWNARIDDDGGLVLLRDQDRRLWDRRAIADAVRLIERSAELKSLGRYQVEAAISAVHCEASSWAETDWPQISNLYALLARIDPSPIVELNRAVAVSHVSGAAIALRNVDALTSQLEGYHLFHAVRAALLQELGREAEAARANRRALALTRNPAEQRLIHERLAGAT